MTEETHNDIVLALMTEHRTALAGMRALMVIYRALLEKAGIEPPEDADGAEALRRYRNLYERAGFDDRDQHPELLSEWWVKAAV